MAKGTWLTIGACLAIAGAACSAGVDELGSGSSSKGRDDNSDDGTGANSGSVPSGGNSSTPSSDGTGSTSGTPSSTGTTPMPGPGTPLPGTSTTLPDGRIPTEDDIFMLAGLSTGAEQNKKVCDRGGTNKLTTALCGATPASIKGLKDLQAALGLAFPANAATGRGNNANGGNPGFVVMGHSSSLVARFTNAINPRTVVFTANPNRNNIPNFAAMGFVRGEQFAEIVVGDPGQNTNRFFLVKFEQACNATKSCKPGDLLTPAVETNWTGFTVYEDVDVKNTIVDCTQCHQPNGATTPKMLRFQELRNPWTHMFRNNTPGGQALLADFHAAHGTAEDYGLVPANQIDSSDPAQLENLVRGEGFGAQPNEFQTRTIEGEVQNSSPNQPANNATPGTSATWAGLYDQFVQGKNIAPPYHDVKVTDPTKLATMTAAYKTFLGGGPAADLPDIRKAFLDSQAWAMGFGAKPGLTTGAQVITQMCTQCHNPNLDQTITRAKFDATKLATMTRAEKDIAIQRVQLTEGNPRRMPPARFRDLTPAEIQLAIDELKK